MRIFRFACHYCSSSSLFHGRDPWNLPSTTECYSRPKASITKMRRLPGVEVYLYGGGGLLMHLWTTKVPSEMQRSVILGIDGCRPTRFDATLDLISSPPFSLSSLHVHFMLLFSPAR
jgi:hypothetical protein